VSLSALSRLRVAGGLGASSSSWHLPVRRALEFERYLKTGSGCAFAARHFGSVDSRHRGFTNAIEDVIDSIESLRRLSRSRSRTTSQLSPALGFRAVEKCSFSSAWFRSARPFCHRNSSPALFSWRWTDGYTQWPLPLGTCGLFPSSTGAAYIDPGVSRTRKGWSG
jgi:hypothetical protein